MSKMTPEKIRKLALKGRLVPIIEQRNGKHYLLGYGRKETSRKSDKYMLPEPEELTGK
jgi:hypothetical protein